MKTLNLYVILITAVLSLFSCKKKDNDSDAVSPSTQAAIVIGNNPFHPTSTKALSNAGRAGYDIVLTDNQTAINLSTSTKNAGTYVACNTCRLAADSAKTFSGNLTTLQGEYNIKQGTLVLSVNSNGTLDAIFTFEAVDNNNNTINIKEGKVTNLGIMQVTEEENFKTILQSKNWYITRYDFSLVNEVSQSGEFVKDSTVTGTSQGDGECTGTFKTWHLWNHYQAKFTDSTMIGIYNLTEVVQKADTSCNVYTTATTKSDTRNKNWTYNSGTKKLTTDFGNILDAGVGTDSDFSTNYDIISYSSGKIVLEGTKQGTGGQSFYGKIVLE